MLSYALITVIYLSACAILLDIYPGHQVVIDSIAGMVAAMGFKIIEISAYIAGKNNNEIIGIGFKSVPYVRNTSIIIVVLWVCILVMVFLQRNEHRRGYI